jgi:hypothetical protein
MSDVAKAVIGVGAVLGVVGLLYVSFLASSITGVGVQVEKLERVSTFSFQVDEKGLGRAEIVLTDYARERSLKLSRLDIPVGGRKAFHLQIALIPSLAVLTADNTASPNRLDVRVSSAAPAEKWQPAVRDIESRLQIALGRAERS